MAIAQTYSFGHVEDAVTRVWGAVQPTEKTPSKAATHREIVKVVYELPDVGLIYADAVDQTRYFIDSQTDIDFVPRPGQKLSAEVNDEGYVLSASLASG